MKRTRKKAPERKTPADAILASDLHLTDSTPVSRTDDYLGAQRSKLLFLQSLSDENGNCPILCAGDVFDYWKASPWLCLFAFTFLPRPFITIPGQHDLPMHSSESYGKSALSLIDSVCDDVHVVRKDFVNLDDIGILNNIFITGMSFGALSSFDPATLPPTAAERKVLILHELTWRGKRPPWDKGSWTDLELIEEFGEHFDLILTGDNHGGFLTKQGSALLVNPGSMMRMNADQEDYKPRCYLYYAETNEATPVYFPIEPNVHDREHINQKKEREDRTTAYIANISQWENKGLSFRRNLESFFTENATPQKIKDVIMCHLETEKS